MAYSSRGGARGGGFLVAIIAALFALYSYFSNTQINPITNEKQRISLSTEQEVALGLQSAPQMVQRHGGLHPDAQAQLLVDRVGKELVRKTVASKSKYEFDFHLLADNRTVNAFALPGGQIFLTAALYSRLESIDQLAGVLGHEIGHVIGRHSAERIAKQQLTEGLTGAAVLATYDPSNPTSGNTAQVAAMIGNLVNMKYGREDELESDDFGVRLMYEAGYNPEALIGVMRILEQASGGRQGSEFFSTHPSPKNRVQRIQEAILKYRK